MLVICLIAVCLIQEDTAARCSAEPGATWLWEKPLGPHDLQSVHPSVIYTTAHQACRREARELLVPANHRVISFAVERRAAR
jgi:hypothetical protein